jgi:serine/threonine protein kinase
MHVVHRDLKAQNVLLDEQGHAKVRVLSMLHYCPTRIHWCMVALLLQVCDFGISKFKERTFLSTRNMQAGTPAYM